MAVAPTIFSQGDHIGDSAIHRDAYNAYFQDTWKVSPNFSVDYGLRYEINSPIREQARRTSGLVLSGPGVPGSTFVINPQPGYELDKKGLAPRLALHWHAAAKTQLLAAAGITTSIPNVWQDNSLTGATPFVVYPRATAAPGQPVRFGTTITPQQLPAVYTPDGALIFGSGSSRNVKPNTLMDLSRFEADMAALSPDHQVTPLVVAGVAGNFQNGYISTWTAGVEQQLGGVSVSGAYVGTSGNKLPVFDFPNGFPGAEPGFAPYTQFDSAGRPVGGYGEAMLITNRSHSSYHSFQLSAQNSLSRFGLGFQASYSLSKSLDDASSVLNAGMPQDPFDTNAEKGPSSFDIHQAANFSLYQDLHADRAPGLRYLGKTIMGGWQLLGIGTAMTGLPFTVTSGIQQTGVGSIGTDRPDQVAIPVFSTTRTVREDYFGRGAGNGSFFHIPINVAGGPGRIRGASARSAATRFAGRGSRISISR